MRQVVLDTETTGLEIEEDHRILEIGCVELIDRKFTRRHYHQYINPEREIDDGALEVHGIARDFLDDKPVFAEIAEDFLDFIRGAEVIIHNAAFDVAFINHEIARLGQGIGKVEETCTVIDSLELARKKHPGQRNSLDALCKRYKVDNSQRVLHGALLDAEILADVYLLMTGGQVRLALDSNPLEQTGVAGAANQRLRDIAIPLAVLRATPEEIELHEKKLDEIDDTSEHGSVWRAASPARPVEEGES